MKKWISLERINQWNTEISLREVKLASIRSASLRNISVGIRFKVRLILLEDLAEPRYSQSVLNGYVKLDLLLIESLLFEDCKSMNFFFFLDSNIKSFTSRSINIECRSMESSVKFSPLFRWIQWICIDSTFSRRTNFITTKISV